MRPPPLVLLLGLTSCAAWTREQCIDQCMAPANPPPFPPSPPSPGPPPLSPPLPPYPPVSYPLYSSPESPAPEFNTLLNPLERRQVIPAVLYDGTTTDFCAENIAISYALTTIPARGRKGSVSAISRPERQTRLSDRSLPAFAVLPAPQGKDEESKDTDLPPVVTPHGRPLSSVATSHRDSSCSRVSRRSSVTC